MTAVIVTLEYLGLVVALGHWLFKLPWSWPLHLFWSVARRVQQRCAIAARFKQTHLRQQEGHAKVERVLSNAERRMEAAAYGEPAPWQTWTWL